MRCAPAGRSILATWLSVTSLACVSPNLVIRVDDSDAGTQAGAGGSPGGISGGATGGKTTGSGSGGGGGGGGSPGTSNMGAGGGVAVGGRTGSAGTTGAGGTVIGPTANFMDNFETDHVELRWIWDAPNVTALRPSGDAASVCGDWAVVSDGTTTNHVFQQRSSCSGSNPSWAATGSTLWTDMRLQARVQFGAAATTSTIITLGVRFTDDRNQYYLQFSNDGKLKIRAKVEAGSASSDINDVSKMRVPVPAGQWVTIALAISGTTASVYLGDDPTAAPVLTGPVSGLSAGGIAIGVAGGPASFDDILVTPP
jgi:hypothetical protein